MIAVGAQPLEELELLDDELELELLLELPLEELELLDEELELELLELEELELLDEELVPPDPTQFGAIKLPS